MLQIGALMILALATLQTPRPAGAEAVSLFGKPLFSLPLSEETRQDYEEKLAEARRDSEARPDDVDAAVWVGRRIAYLGRFRDSIQYYTESLNKFGPNAKLLRHRGHRYITLREFDKAIADFEQAAKLIEGTADEVEPDGMPNARNQPVSSLHSNVWYHLALARYLTGDFEKALEACRRGMAVSANPDRLVSQTYWLYLTLRRLGRDEEASAALEPIKADLDVIENGAYLRLLLVYKGELKPEDVLSGASGAIEEPTTAYGIGMHYLLHGNREKAFEAFTRSTSGPSWPAFGFIAAEVELKRMEVH